MSRLKKCYCRVSFIFAIVVLVFVCSLCIINPNVVSASESDRERLTQEQKELTSFDERTTGEHKLNSSNGLSITYNNDSGSLSTPVKMLLVLTILALAPSILIMLTSFTRIITPPNQVMVGLALFLTFFIMWPTFQTINTNAIQPLDAGEITQEEAFKEAEKPLREFMYGQTQVKDIELFVEIQGGQEYEDYEDIPFTTLVPAFILSELRTAFILGFLIYIPFIVIDMVVASVLMSMGMMMLPPTTISLPFKILLFVLADGWNLVIGNLVKTFY